MIDRLYPGGTETQLVALIRHLDRARVRPFLCLLDGLDPTSQGMEPTDCPVVRLGVRSLRKPRALGKALEFARFLRRHRVDILQIYFPDSTYFGVPVARMAGVPHVLRTRNNINHWMTPTHLFLGRILNRFVSATVTNCEASRQAVLADEAPSPSSVLVMENGVDVQAHSSVAPAETTVPAPAALVGIVANLRHVKGVDVLVDAAASVCANHPAARFVVAGDGDERPALEEQIARRQLGGRFQLLGNLSNIPEFLATLQVAVLSSRAEGMPNAVLEYMASGRPIVATAVGGAPRLIEHEVHGLLIPPENPALLAASIDRLLRDRGLAQRLATAARNRVRAHYSRDAMVRNLESFYRRLVVEGKPTVMSTNGNGVSANGTY